MMKKYIAVIMAVAITFSFAACNNAGWQSDTTENEPAQSSTQPPVDSDDTDVEESVEDASGEDTYEEATPEIGVLTGGATFTGTTQIAKNNDFHGGYFYSDITEDRMTVIINSGFTNDLGVDETPEEYIGRCIDLICEYVYTDLSINDTTLDSYPAYYLEWITGQNEDTRKWCALMVTTDLYTYVYAFHAPVDHAEEMYEVWDEAFGNITLEFPNE